MSVLFFVIPAPPSLVLSKLQDISKNILKKWITERNKLVLIKKSEKNVSDEWNLDEGFEGKTYNM